jgi:hypothetical protein
MTLFWNVSTETPSTKIFRLMNTMEAENLTVHLKESGPEHISAPYLYYRSWRNPTIRYLTYLKQRNENSIICVEGRVYLYMQLLLFAERLL